MGKVKGRCVILGGGEIADYSALSAELRPDDFIICADSGYRHCAPLGVGCDLLVGDFDSLPGPLPKGIEIVRLPENKDYTDTALAAEEAIASGCGELFFSGLTGGRLDHTLANLQLMAGIAAGGIPARMSDGVDYATAFHAPLMGKELVLPSRDGYYFSVFGWTVCRAVCIRGGKYPLRNYDLRPDEARAVSNEFMGVPVRISLEEGTVIVLETPLRTAPKK